jgi:ABC-type sugar transport system ATPase subunit
MPSVLLIYPGGGPSCHPLLTAKLQRDHHYNRLLIIRNAVQAVTQMDERSRAGSPAPALALVGVDRFFGATHAVRSLDLELYAGSVHSLVGENGAGKSTAGKIAAGVLQPTSGHLEVGGRRRHYRSARDAEADGVVFVPQELQLYDSLSVEDNMFAGRRRPRTAFGTLSRAAMRRDVEQALARLGLDLDRRVQVGRLSPGMKQMVTIARGLVSEVKVLVLDEPTAALDEWEAQRLLEVVEGLRRDGVAILYVSHRLHEVMAVSDVISVLRDGALIRCAPAAELDQDTLVEHMLGREMLARARTESRSSDRLALEVRDLSRAGEFGPVSFEVRRGEVVGLAGIVGAGRSELGQAICGITRPTGGRLRVAGRDVRLSGVRDATRHGVAYVPEERQSQGLFMTFSVEDNVAMSSLGRLGPAGTVLPRRVRSLAEKALRGLALRGRLDDHAGSLSGGNQQKVLVAKWLATDPDVLILDEPTRGIDIGARSEIYAIIDRLTANGCGMLLISSDLQELLLLSDRILVMREGRLVAEFGADDMTESAVGRAALGVVGDEATLAAEAEQVTL